MRVISKLQILGDLRAHTASRMDDSSSFNLSYGVDPMLHSSFVEILVTVREKQRTESFEIGGKGDSLVPRALALSGRRRGRRLMGNKVPC